MSHCNDDDQSLHLHQLHGSHSQQVYSFLNSAHRSKRAHIHGSAQRGLQHLTPARDFAAALRQPSHQSNAQITKSGSRARIEELKHFRN